MFNKISLYLGIALSILAVILINVHVSSLKRDEARVQVLRALQLISAGQSPEGRIELVTVPKRLAAKLPNPVGRKDLALIRKKKAIDDIRGGAFLLWSHFEETQSGLDRAVMQELTKGKRAMSVPVKFTSAVAGWVRPGDRVDVLATFSVPDDSGKPKNYTLTVKQNMKVLAVGWKDRQSEALVRGRSVDRHPKSVILEVSPIEAELLNFTISQKATVLLTLRSPDDDTEETLPRMNMDVFMHIRDSTKPTASGG